MSVALPFLFSTDIVLIHYGPIVMISRDEFLEKSSKTCSQDLLTAAQFHLKFSIRKRSGDRRQQPLGIHDGWQRCAGRKLGAADGAIYSTTIYSDRGNSISASILTKPTCLTPPSACRSALSLEPGMAALGRSPCALVLMRSRAVQPPSFAREQALT